MVEVQKADSERPFKDLEARVIVDSEGNQYLISEAEMAVEPGNGIVERQRAKLAGIALGDFLRITFHPWPQPTGFNREVEVLSRHPKKEIEWS